MRRHILGIIALVLLAGAVYFQFQPPETGGGKNLQSACTRVGALCAAIWLAYHELERLPSWIGSVLAVATVIVAVKPKLAIIAIPLVVTLMILGRKKKT